MHIKGLLSIFILVSQLLDIKLPLFIDLYTQTDRIRCQIFFLCLLRKAYTRNLHVRIIKRNPCCIIQKIDILIERKKGQSE